MAVFSCVCAQGVSENAYSAIVVPDRVYSYDRMVDDLEKLKSRYSLIMTGGHIGTSVEGRKIPAVRLGRGSHKILVCAALHAREHITTNYLMYFLLSSLSFISLLLFGINILILILIMVLD